MSRIRSKSSAILLLVSLLFAGVFVASTASTASASTYYAWYHASDVDCTAFRGIAYTQVLNVANTGSPNQLINAVAGPVSIRFTPNNPFGVASFNSPLPVKYLLFSTVGPNGDLAALNADQSGSPALKSDSIQVDLTSPNLHPTFTAATSFVSITACVTPLVGASYVENDFSNVPIGAGESLPATLTLGNSQTDPIDVRWTNDTGVPGFTYNVQPNTCGVQQIPVGSSAVFTLPPGVICHLPLTLSADRSAALGGRFLTIQFNARATVLGVLTDFPAQTVTLHATAMGGGFVPVYVNNAVLVPGSPAANTRHLTMWNTEPTALAVPAFGFFDHLSRVAGSPATDCVEGTDVPAGGSCTLDVVFDPTLIPSGNQTAGYIQWVDALGNIGAAQFYWSVPSDVVYTLSPNAEVAALDGATVTQDLEITSTGGTGEVYAFDQNGGVNLTGSSAFSITGGTCFDPNRAEPDISVTPCTVSVTMTAPAGVDPFTASTEPVDASLALTATPTLGYGATQTVTIALHRFRPANDSVYSPEIVSPAADLTAPFDVTGTTVGATPEMIDSVVDPLAERAESSVWYSWTAPATGAPTGVAFSTDNPNTFVDVIPASDVAALLSRNVADFSTGPGPNGIDVQPGVTYLVRVGSLPTNGGPFTLTISAGSLSGGGGGGGAGTGPAPTFGTIPDVPATAVDPSGAVVTYNPVFATDVNSNQVLADCAPASGSTFSVGATTVTCLATYNGATASASFQVVVAPVAPSAPVITSVTANLTTTGAIDVSFAAGWNGGAPDLYYSLLVAWTGGSSAAEVPAGSTSATLTGIPLGTDGLVVTVFATNPQGHGASATAPVPVLVPPGAVNASTAPAGSTAYSTITTPSGTVTSTATGTGSGSVTTSQYPPGTPIPIATGTPFVQSGANPFDVVVSKGNSLSSVKITSCPAVTGSHLWWFDSTPVTGGWKTVSPASAEVNNGLCITFTATTSTHPSIADLTGTVFAVSPAPASATVVPTATQVTTGGSTDITTTVVDAGNNPVPGATVVLTPSTGSAPVTGTTDSNGAVTLLVSESAPGDVLYSASANGIAVGSTTIAFIAPPTIGGTPTVGEVGLAYNSSLSAVSSLPVTFSATGLPVGVTIDAQGVLSGIPTAAGAYNAQVTATTSLTSTTSPVSLTIVPALAITTASLPTGTAGSAYSANVVSTGGKSPVGWSATGLPSGLTIGATNGQITGSTSNAFSGTITVTALDALGASASATYTLTINAAPPPPPPPPAGADLSVALSASAFQSGEDGKYTVRVASNGSANVTGAVVVKDVLPAGVAYRGASGSGWRCAAVGPTVTCTLASGLAVGRTSTLTIAVRVTAPWGVAVTNKVSVSGNFTDPSPADDSAIVTTVVRRG